MLDPGSMYLYVPIIWYATVAFSRMLIWCEPLTDSVCTYYFLENFCYRGRRFPSISPQLPFIPSMIHSLIRFIP